MLLNWSCSEGAHHPPELSAPAAGSYVAHTYIACGGSNCVPFSAG